MHILDNICRKSKFIDLTWVVFLSYATKSSSLGVFMAYLNWIFLLLVLLTIFVRIYFINYSKWGK